MVEDDLETIRFKASGPGGQHRNKTETGVRLRHAPSGIEVTSANQRSLGQNAAKARAELLRRLNAQGATDQLDALNGERRRQVSGVDRSAKNFTWNWMRDEVIDHATGRRIRLSDALAGRLGKLTK